MPSISCIVVATDFSEFSERAVQRAARIANQHNAELHVLHVVRPLDLYPSLTLTPDEFGHSDQELQQAEQTRVEAVAASLSTQLGIRVRAVTRLGRAHTEIAAYAQAVAADLVVAGSRGESTLLDLFLGSTASRLLRVATCPVLIVKKPADEPYRKVLAAVDFSPVSAAVVSHAISLADGARVDALHVLGSEVEQRLRKAKFVRVDIADWLTRQRTEAEQQLDALLTPAEQGAAVGRLVQPGFPPAVICQSIEAMGVDLVVLGRHGYGGGLQDWLLGSVSKDVAHAAACDVLLISLGGQ
ncbi:universal stress protein [Thiobacillus denitrificans]|uniref:Universal stress protein n=1 Tax=Thiobacillus denitrificans TaxID=36861 RepID=A0A125BDR6_THIDE|nr:universal stress protein [Thiobacillus denitrificans]KVW99494.1 universal stress protein [Thiobacillus denitrificans]